MWKIMSLIGALGFASTVSLAQPGLTRSVRDGIYTADQAARGRTQYSEHCAACHMSDLAGRVDPAATPRNRMSSAPALRGSEFVAKWNDMSVRDLFERIRISMPQWRPGSLARQQNADILAFILQENGFALGLEELPTADPLLATIRFEP